MSRTIEQIRAELDAKIPRDVIAQRDGGGRKLSYLEGHYVIDRLNQVLGQGNWAYEAEEMRLVFEGPIEGRGGASFNVSYIARVRLTASIDGLRVTFTDYGYGDGMDKGNPGKAHELAVKEATTDGIKRCAKSLGMSLGLALYSKDQENVSEESDGEERQAPKPTGSGPRQAPKEDRGSVAGYANGPAAPVPASSEGSSGIPAEPPKERTELNGMIAKMSAVVIGKRLITLEALKTDLTAKYGTFKKEDLKDEQAREVYGALRAYLSA